MKRTLATGSSTSKGSAVHPIDPAAEPMFPWADTWPEITDRRVRSAFAHVSRANFVAADLRDVVGRDSPLPIGEGQTTSQPFVVAWMVQALALQSGDRVLEIGFGSGYQTAILCEVTAQPGQSATGANVYAVERSAALARQAAHVLHTLGYQPHLQVGDGAAGWPDAAPFVGIVVSAAATHVPRALWEQIADGGRLVIPVGGEFGNQTLWLLHKRNGEMISTEMGPVRFVPFLSPLLDNPQNWIEIQ